MFRRLISSAVMVLIVSGVARAALYQEQGFELLGRNLLGLENGGAAGGAFSANELGVSNFQVGSGPVGNVTNFQSNDTYLTQAAALGGIGGTFGVEQTGTGLGWQAQLHPGGLGVGVQNQDLQAALGQEFIKLGGGDGMAVGGQVLVGNQVQINATIYGATANVQSVGVIDVGAVIGAYGAAFGYNGAVGIGLDQGQNP